MPPKKITGARAATLPSVLVRTVCSSPGTPRRVAASSKGACQNGAESVVTDCQTCPMCALVIVETTDDMEGQEALLCEGSCNHWYHRWCAGVTKARYEALSSSEDPFFCPSCSATRQQKSIVALQASLRSLSDEVRELKALVVTLQKKERPTSELCPGAQTVGAASAQWSTAVGRKGPKKFGKGMGSKQSTPAGASSSPSPNTTPQSNSTSQPSLSSNPRPRSSHGQTRVRVTGARKIWGTMKSTTAAAVADALKALAKSPQNALSVKRKYKINAKRVTHWWFVIRGEESLLEQLQSNWHLVNVQTAWKLEPVFKHQTEDSPQPADTLLKESAIAGAPAPSTPSSVHQQHTLNKGLQTSQDSDNHSIAAAVVPSDHSSVEQASDNVCLDNRQPLDHTLNNALQASQCLGSHPVTTVPANDNASNSFFWGGEN